ncbi:MAG: thioesterase family protein [Pseudomonadota bacterium]
MMFERPLKVLFRHCDPAGLVFYPRYFEMLNDHVEAFFDHIGHPFEELHKQRAVPTAEVSATFHAPSRHGDALTWALALTRLGRTSAGVEVSARAGAEMRATFRSTLVLVDLNGAPVPWSEAQRGALAPYVKEKA